MAIFAVCDILLVLGCEQLNWIDINVWLVLISFTQLYNNNAEIIQYE